LQEHYLSLTEYLHSFSRCICANVGSKTLISLNDVPKSTSAAAAKPLNGIFALSNFALVIAPVVIATSPVLPIVTAPDNSTAAASPLMSPTNTCALGKLFDTELIQTVPL
jgi:hypothetical protein